MSVTLILCLILILALGVGIAYSDEMHLEEWLIPMGVAVVVLASVGLVFFADVDSSQDRDKDTIFALKAEIAISEQGLTGATVNASRRSVIVVQPTSTQDSCTISLELVEISEGNFLLVPAGSTGALPVSNKWIAEACSAGAG